MKKRICLFILCFIMMFFIEGHSVEGRIVMYMECDLENQIGVVEGFELANAYNIVFRYKGDAVFKNDQYDMILTSQSEDNCWHLNANSLDDTNKLCDNSNYSIFSEKKCPKYMRYSKGVSTFEYYSPITGGITKNPFSKYAVSTLVLGGQQEPDVIEFLEEPEYVFYKFVADGKEYIIGEGYDDDGNYCYVNNNVLSEYSHESGWQADWAEALGLENLQDKRESYDAFYLSFVVGKYGEDYFKVARNENVRNVFAFGYCKDVDDCKKNYGYEEIISSEKPELLSNALDLWYNDVGFKLDALNEYVEFNKDDNFKKVSETLVKRVQKGSAYSFDNSYSASKLLKDLERAYELLVLVEKERENFTFTSALTGKETNLLDAAQTNVFKYLFGYARINDLQKGIGRTNKTVSLGAMINSDIEERLKSKLKNDDGDVNEIFDYISNDDTFKNDVERFMKVTSYFNYMSSHTDLTDDEIERLSKLNDKMIDFAGKYKIYPNLFSCSNLIGDDLQNKIISYFNIIRIAIPILLMGLGIMEFVKAVFAGDDDLMKKAQKNFLTRIAISVLFFLTPTIVNIILDLANSVWLNINPDTCIKF